MPSQKSILKALILSISIHLIIILLLAQLIQTRKLFMSSEQPKLLVSFQSHPKELRITPRKRVKVRSPILTNPRRNIVAETRLSTEREVSIEQSKILPILAKPTKISPFLADLNANNVSVTDGLDSIIKFNGVSPPASDYSRATGDFRKGFRPIFRNKNTFVQLIF